MESLHRQLQAMNVRRVILVPQGMLHLLPLHAACYETTPGQARFFLNEYEVGYAPSGGVLARCQARRAGDRAGQAAEPFVAVADPTGDLPFAGLEVDAIRRLLARPPVVLGGPERGAGQLAASGAVLAALGSARIFHFAGHGAYNWQDPLDSALLCCGKSPGHGRGSDPVAASDPLTLRSLLNGPSPERLRLVVLSACETGLTDIGQAADEYIGLPAGFLQAGAPAVVSSLWAVDDLSTALLMEEFYRRHLGEGQGIAQALRGAQLWLRDLKRDDLLSRVAAAREEARTHPDRRLWARLDALREALSEDYGPEDRPFAHPYYWAAFIASGAV
jgi:CHAT domain-containing protein